MSQIMPSSARPYRPLHVILSLAAISLSAIQAWAGRNWMNSDGVSYLDIGDAYFRGDWSKALNSYWSPLYSWILGLVMVISKPRPRLEYPLVHAVNVATFVFSLFAFNYLLAGLVRDQQATPDDPSSPSAARIPTWCWLLLGYTLFSWASVELLTVQTVSPDILTAAFVYMTAGLLCRLHRRGGSRRDYALLGLTIGLGYLTKAPMFLLAVPFLLSHLCISGPKGPRVRGLATAFVAFAAISAPFVVALSIQKARPTFGEVARLSYAWYVNGAAYRHWQGEPLYAETPARPGRSNSPALPLTGSGVPRHPTRKVLDWPPIYEFGTPVGGTYPPWYDESYWYEGLAFHFNFARQLRVLRSNAWSLAASLFNPRVSMLLREERLPLAWSPLFLVVVAAFLPWRNGLRGVMKSVSERPYLVLPAVTACTMFASVHLELRLVAPFVVLLYLNLLGSVRLKSGKEAGRRFGVATGLLCVAFVAVEMPARVGDILAERINGAVASKEGDKWNFADIADGLGEMGLLAGDRVAVLEYSNRAHVMWARLARVTIVAELYLDAFERNEQLYWLASEEQKRTVMEEFRHAGARVVIAQAVPSGMTPAGWRQVRSTRYWAYFFDNPGLLGKGRETSAS